MSGLISSIYANSQSLKAHSAAISVAGNNLANVDNDAYARQRISLGSIGSTHTPEGISSMGVTALSVTHVRDAIIDAQIVREGSVQGSLQSQNEIASWIESVLGESISTQTSEGSQTGLSYAIDEFFAAWQSYSANPTENAEKQAVIEASNVLTDMFHSIDNSLENMNTNILTEINSQTSEVDTLLKDIASLNDKIARVSVRNEDGALDMIDARQAKLEELSQYMEFTTRADPDGLNQIQVVASDTTGGDVILVDGAKVNGSMSYSAGEYSAGLPSTILDLTSGSLGGLESIRSGLLTDTRNSLDALASEFVSAVNSAYGSDFFRTDAGDPTLYTTAADIQLDPSISTATLDAGSSADAADNDIALAIAQLSNNAFSTGGGDDIDGTFGDFYNDLVTRVGTEVSSTAQQFESSQMVSDLLSEQRQSISGVSLDEEMTNLITFQRAYQGSARVINVMDSMLELVVTRLGNF